MGDYSDLSLILDVYQTPAPFDKKEGPNPLQHLAFAAYDPRSKFKDVVVNMRGVNGNVLVIVGTVKKALAGAGATPTELFLFVGDALSGDYEHALATIYRWVTITDEEPKETPDAWQAFVEVASKEDE